MQFDQYQQVVLDEVEHGSGHLVVKARAGSGKCLGKGTKVVKYDGTVVPVEEVRDGDVLMGLGSRPRKVLRTNHGVGPLFEIRPVKGDPWVCNDVHVLTLVNSVTNEVRDVALDDYLAHAGTTFNKDAKLFRAPIELPRQPWPEGVDPYLIGLWLGDGTSDQPSITQHESDKETREYCQRIAAEYGTELVIHRDKRSPSVLNLRFRVGPRGVAGRNTPNKVWRAFASCLVDGKKRIPAALLRTDQDTRRRVLAGLIDTDGYVGSNCVDIVSSLPALAEDILYLARSLGLAAYARIKQVNGAAYTRISISGADLALLPVLLPRKKVAPRRQKKDVRRTGFRATYIGEGEYFGFTLDGDGRFLLGDFTVTHNTTTIIEAVRRIIGRGDILLSSFGTEIMKELERRAPQGCKVRTLHSLGLGTLSRHIGRDIEVDKRKDWRIAARVVREQQRKRSAARGFADDLGFYVPMLVKLTELAKDTLVASIDEVVALAELHGFSDKRVPADVMADMAASCMRYATDEAVKGVVPPGPAGANAKPRRTVAFSDMLYLCAKMNYAPDPFDYVFIDEYQDLNPGQVAFVQRLVRPGGRIIAIGDPQQGIYAWRGADRSAMDRLERDLGAKVLPLSVTYRCPVAVVNHVKRFVPDLEARPGAPEGEVRDRDMDELFGPYGPNRGDFVLSRTNKELAGVCMGLLRKHVPAVIAGKDVGKKLVDLVEESRANTVAELEMWMSTLLKDESDRIAKIADDGEKAAAQEHFDELLDEVESVRAVAEGETQVVAVLQALNMMFSDTIDEDYAKNIVVCSTVHKAKGKERDTVWLLRSSFFKPGGPAAGFEEEQNIYYVAATRARERLFIVRDPTKKSRKDA